MNLLNGFNAVNKPESVKLTTSLSMDEPTEEVASIPQIKSPPKQENVNFFLIFSHTENNFFSSNFQKHK